MLKHIVHFLLCCCFIVTDSASADPEACRTVRFADTGWSDISATTAAAASVLNALGYDTQTRLLSVPVTYVALKNGTIDVFLGNWMPTMAADIAPYLKSGDVESVRANLEGARYTLAVPSYVAAAEVTSFSDIALNGSKFGYKIHGLEPGNDGNRIIQKLISERAFDLGNFKLVESNEAGLLKTISEAIARQDWIIFLAWEPHPVNHQFGLSYLDGGDLYFGPDYGRATVHTNVRRGYLEACPNVGRFLQNLVFTLDMENALMDLIMNEKLNPEQAFKRWLAEDDTRAGIIEAWLSGVKKFNDDAIEAGGLTFE